MNQCILQHTSDKSNVTFLDFKINFDEKIFVYCVTHIFFNDIDKFRYDDRASFLPSKINKIFSSK